MAQTTGSNNPPLTIGLKVFVPLGLLNTAGFLWLESNYASTMPRQPQPETGRTHELMVDRGQQVFVTENEAAWHSRLTTLEFVLVFCVLISFYLWIRKKGVRS